MFRHTPAPAQARSVLLILFAASLAACGGGGGSSSSAPAVPTPTPPPIAKATISGKVADGPLSGAQVCYDVNANGSCEVDEPTSAPTDAEGRYSFEIDPAMAGLHRVVAMVPPTAVDKDTGSAVGASFTLIAPATGTTGSHAVFVSPLTTLVQAHIDATGGAADGAAAFVQTEGSLAVSALADFTASTDAAHRQAATVARLLLLTLKQKTAALNAVVDQTDLSGTLVTEEQLRQVIQRELLGVLPAVAVAAAGSAVRDAATPADRESALVQAADNLASLHIGLGAESAKLAVGMNKLPPDTSAEAIEPAGSLSAFRYQDADNWYYRALLATADDVKLDANGKAHYYDQRSQRLAGQSSTWARGNSPERAEDMHWNGTAWVTCPAGFRSEQSPSDALGRGAYGYCGKLETGVRVRSLIDIAGRSLRSVVETIRQLPGGSAGVDFADWGPTDLNLLGAATMPAGSLLSYQTNTVQTSEVTFDQRASNAATAYPLAIANGGDARNGANPPCNNNAGTSSAVQSLDELITLNPGKPCQFEPNANTGPQNDWWSNSTVNIGFVNEAQTPPPGTGNFFTRTAIVRAGFDGMGSDAVNFYSCMQRTSDGSTRNCTKIGTGKYSIQTRGDGRTMHFSELPELALRVINRRVFIERGGKVYYGSHSLVGRSFFTARLNLPATNALFGQLGLAQLTPIN